MHVSSSTCRRPSHAGVPRGRCSCSHFLAAIVLGGVAVWAVTRSGPFDSTAAAGLLELVDTVPSFTAGPPSHTERLRAAKPHQRLPDETPIELPEDEEDELPF